MIKNRKQYLFIVNFLVSAGIIFSAWLYMNKFETVEQEQDEIVKVDQILPIENIKLPVQWGNIGSLLVKTGVIDWDKTGLLYGYEADLDNEARKLLTESGVDLEMKSQNSGLILNLLWALGFSNKNDILETGPMSNPVYGGPDVFASTAGWTLARGNAMSHYSAHHFVTLDRDSQLLVEQISKNIYRPCCNNPAYFPDCNHGMAILALLELMAAYGADEEEMYRTALLANSYWFPESYGIITKYLQSTNRDWNTVNPKEILGYDFSSASGLREISRKVITLPAQSRGCSI